MQVFLSHSSRQKPLIREIKKALPEHLGSWLDENKLLFGDSIPQSIESVIKSDSDYVLLFIDQYAAASDWVKKELTWALQAEKTHHRTILLPIVIDEGGLEKLDNIELLNRRYLQLQNFQESSVRSLAASITSDLFALVCRDMDSLRNPKPKNTLSTINDTESLLRIQAAAIQKATFPHRKSNPISKEQLLAVINTVGGLQVGEDDFDAILTAILHHNLIPGLVYDGFEVFLVEEHARWKGEVEHAKKERIGRRAAAYIQNGVKLFLDAGSTTDEIVRVICKKIETRSLSQVTIGTTSVSIADKISTTCVKMGFDDDFSAVRLLVPGGRVRPSTQAIVPAFETTTRHIFELSQSVGGFDFGVVGVNGVVPAGFTTHENSEAQNKIDILSVSGRKFIVGDSSKVGITLDRKFADFDDDIHFIVDDDKSNGGLQRLIQTFPNKIELV